MSRDEGFAVMDVSTSVCDDPKFRRLSREHPEHVAAAFMAYVATLGESWRAGRRVSVEIAWPTVLPFDPAVVESMRSVGLIDGRGMPPPKTWAAWFGPAAERRRKSRDRWTRYNAKRLAAIDGSDADATPVPRGSDVGTATSVPTVPSYPPGPSVPPMRAPRNGQENGQKPERTKRGGPVSTVGDELSSLKDKVGWKPAVIEGEAS